MFSKPIPWTVELYPPWSDAGRVRRTIEKLPPKTQVRVMAKIERLEELGPHKLGADHVKKVKVSQEGLWELRFPGASSLRLLFVCVGHTIVIVHAFQKKRNALTKRDVQQADTRAFKVKEHYQELAR